MHNYKSRSFRSFSKTIYYADLLIEEILSKNLPEVKRLMEKAGADPNLVVPERGIAALHLLAGAADEEFGVAATTVALLAAGGDPNVRSEEGLTPVHVAAAWGRARVLEVLLRSGGDPNLLDYYLRDAEDYALRERQWDVYGMLAARSPSDLPQRLWRSNDAKEVKLERLVPVQEEYSDVDTKGDDWLRNFSEGLRLDRRAIRTIRDQRRKTRVYECPTTTEDSSIPEASMPPRRRIRNLNGKAVRVSGISDQHRDARMYNQLTSTEEDLNKKKGSVVPWRKVSNLNEKAVSVVREHWRSRMANSCARNQSEDSSVAVPSPPRLPKRNQKTRCSRTSEMLICELAEASYKTDLDLNSTQTQVQSHTQTSLSQSVNSGDLDSRRQKILCRMSRIFLFMLRKRHIYQKLR